MNPEVQRICNMLKTRFDSLLATNLNSTKPEIRNAFLDVACQAHYSGKFTSASERIYRLGNLIINFNTYDTKHKALSKALNNVRTNEVSQKVVQSNVQTTSVQPRKSPQPRKSKLENPVNPFQKYEVVEEGSPLYIYYSSLYEEKPASKMALKWLVEHGMLNDSVSINKYKSLSTA